MAYNAIDDDIEDVNSRFPKEIELIYKEIRDRIQRLCVSHYGVHMRFVSNASDLDGMKTEYLPFLQKECGESFPDGYFFRMKCIETQHQIPSQYYFGRTDLVMVRQRQKSGRSPCDIARVDQQVTSYLAMLDALQQMFRSDLVCLFIEDNEAKFQVANLFHMGVAVFVRGIEVPHCAATDFCNVRCAKMETTANPSKCSATVTHPLEEILLKMSKCGIRTVDPVDHASPGTADPNCDTEVATHTSSAMVDVD
jgi:hypothetical protein